VTESAIGPLDGERGARSFDVAAIGPAVADDRVTRAASAERHPSITDLSRVAAPGSGDAGRGPAAADPGAVARPTSGTAPASAGVPGVTAPADGDTTRERRYWHYSSQVRDRIQRLLVFPKALALRLEQGETIVRFVIDPDGGVRGGVRVIKSSGFAEFDEAALTAVRRAAPFPAPPPGGAQAAPFPVRLVIPFEDPLIQ
jgi:protein TonB